MHGMEKFNLQARLGIILALFLLLAMLAALVRAIVAADAKIMEEMESVTNLSHREFQIFCMFAEGLNANDIATDLSLSVKSVANYQTQIKEKLGVTSTADLIKLALSNGIIKM
jgi:DNA-binding NarL/FixJ family response regulator